MVSLGGIGATLSGMGIRSDVVEKRTLHILHHTPHSLHTAHIGRTVRCAQIQLFQPMWWGIRHHKEHQPTQSANRTCSPSAVHRKYNIKEPWQVTGMWCFE